MDGTFGLTAAVAEMLLQSHEQVIQLLPALHNSWKTGKVTGLRARGGFEVEMKWENGQLKFSRILSKLGKKCRIKVDNPVDVYRNGKKVDVKIVEEGVIEFVTIKNEICEIKAVEHD